MTSPSSLAERDDEEQVILALEYFGTCVPLTTVVNHCEDILESAGAFAVERHRWRMAITRCVESGRAIKRRKRRKNGPVCTYYEAA